MSQNNTSTLIYLGFDVAKDSLEADPTRLKALGAVDNNPRGHQKLIRAILKAAGLANATPHVVVEATGGYERGFVSALLESDIRVSVVMAGRVRSFANAKGLLSKTDKIDAALISRYAESCQPKPKSPPSKSEVELSELCRRRHLLIAARTVQKNQRPALQLPELKMAADELIKLLDAQIKQIDLALEKLRAQDPLHAAKMHVLCAIDGVGSTSAAHTLAAMPELGTLSRNEASALAGLAPYNRDSGKHQGRRFICGGRLLVRQALYMAALSASRCNPVLAPLYQRLIHNGKAHKVAITALMRRLLIYMNCQIATLLRSSAPSLDPCSP